MTPKPQKLQDNVNSDKQTFINNLSYFIHQMPGFVAWKTPDSIYAGANDLCAKLAGYQNVDSYLGTKDYEWKCEAVEVADKIRQQDELVLKTKKAWHSFNILKFSQSLTYYFSQKSVLYLPGGEILGVLFIGTIVTDASILKMFNTVVKNDPQKTNAKIQCNIYSIVKENDEYQLTPRQEQCMFYLLRGKTSKTIANILGLSVRTVEAYIDDIKNKFQCMNKSELIEKAISTGYFHRVPASLIKNNLIVTDI
jgi:DNA-binding CsgD family transcriptional regulator